MKKAPHENLLLGGLFLALCLSLTACVSGLPPEEGYRAADGTMKEVESPLEACKQRCDRDYARCEDTSRARRRSIDATQGIFGGDGLCKDSLGSCLERCKGR